MSLKKLIGSIHRWLGLASGLIVIILAVTGCVLAFEREIRNLTEPWLHVQEQHKSFQPPSVLKAAAERHLEGKAVNSVEYHPAGEAAIAMYYDAENFKQVYIDPYSAEVVKVKNMNRDFFRVVLEGHYYLWLPHAIGQKVVATATLVFLIMMITGIILWWPRNRAARKQRFSIKWSYSWKRVNYDLHSVLGFYMSWILIFITITGLVWGFQWFEKSIYWVSSGGRSMPAYYSPPSDTMHPHRHVEGILDSSWQMLIKRTNKGESLSVFFPSSPDAALAMSINHRPGTYYDMDNYYFDQYSGAALTGKGTYAGGFRGASAADKLKRMNYDIHVGAVLGLAGKIMAFCGSLLAGSLPVTGFYIWWSKHKKKRNPTLKASVRDFF